MDLQSNSVGNLEGFVEKVLVPKRNFGFDAQSRVLIGGVVVTESVYNIPGLGRLVLDAVLARDYPIIQGLILFFSFVYILLNLLIDPTYTFLDPRIRY